MQTIRRNGLQHHPQSLPRPSLPSSLPSLGCRLYPLCKEWPIHAAYCLWRTIAHRRIGAACRETQRSLGLLSHLGPSCQSDLRVHVTPLREAKARGRRPVGFLFLVLCVYNNWRRSWLIPYMSGVSISRPTCLFVCAHSDTTATLPRCTTKQRARRAPAVRTAWSRGEAGPSAVRRTPREVAAHHVVCPFPLRCRAPLSCFLGCVRWGCVRNCRR